jgi:hypothetical protein
MNPFTRFLRQGSDDDDLDEFISYWDRLEALTIQVYREEIGLDAAGSEFESVWSWLRRRYPNWRAQLEPYWRRTEVEGLPAPTDPFQLLLDVPNLETISGNWKVMQHLPTAREAINQLVLHS